MCMKSGLLGLLAVMAFAAQAARLTYVGADKGSWLAAGAWQDESGTAGNWSDGATAVIGDFSLVVPTEGVTAEGIEWTTTAKRTISGDGKLTLGAGGIVNGGTYELNIQNKGGIHLAADQTWHTTTTAAMPLICLDGLRSVTTAEGVTLTVTGKTSLRWNAKAELPASTTVHVIAPAAISFADGTATFGNPTVILDGDGSRVSFGSQYDREACVEGVFASTLYLRNGADFKFNEKRTTKFGIPRIVVDATQTAAQSSVVSGAGIPELTRGSMEIDVAEGCHFKLSVSCTEADAVTAGFVKKGAGTMTLASPQANFSGGVDVQAGTLEISGDAAVGTGPLTAAAGATVTLPANGTLANELSGAGTFRKATAGAVTLTGAAAAFSGRIVVSTGTVRAAPSAVGGGKILPEAGGAWVVPGDAAFETDVAPLLDADAAGMVLAGAGTTLTVQTRAADELPGLDAEKDGTLRIASLAGSGWTKSAEGNVRVDSLADYSGTTITVSGGVLQLAASSVIPAGCVVTTSDAGIVQFDSADGYDAAKIAGTKSVAFADGASLTVDTSNADGVPAQLAVAAGQTLNVTALTGTGDFYKTGAGTINLSGAENFAGRIIVQDGTLSVTGAAGENTVVVENGIFSATGSGTVLRNTFDVQGGTLQATDGASLGAGGLTLAAAGTVCVTDGGMFGQSAVSTGAGKIQIASGGVVREATALTVAKSGKLIVSDGTGVQGSVTLAGGTLHFDAETTLGCPVSHTANSDITVSEGTTATIAGKFTNNGGKCYPKGPGHLVFTGGGEFLASGRELFVQGGSVEIAKNDFTFKAYCGVEGSGRRLVVRDGAKLLVEADGVGLRIVPSKGQSVLEVGQGGEVELKSGAHVLLGMYANTVGHLRITEGGVFRHAASGSFKLGDRAGATGIVEVVKGTLETGKSLAHGNGSGVVRFEDAALKALADVTLVDDDVSGEMRGTNTLACDAYGVALGGVWTGAGSLAVTGAGETASFRRTTSSPDWTGPLSVTGADLALDADVALANYPVTVVDGGVSVAEGTASLPLLGGSSATKAGTGMLVLSGVQDAAFDLTVEAGGVQVAPGARQQPAGVPALWLDASVKSSFLLKDDGTSITNWMDRRKDVPLYAKPRQQPPLYNENGFNGKPFVDFGVMATTENGPGDNRMLQFNVQQDNIRTVFWMIGSRNGGGFLLGDDDADGSARCFHRGGSTLGAVASDALWNQYSDRGGYVRTGTTWRNGVQIDGTKTGLGGAWDLVSWRLSEANDAANATPSAIWLATCYNSPAKRLNGGQDLAEILIYTNRLTDAEVRATQRYLADKWMPTNAANRVSLGTLTMRGANTSFTVDEGVPAFVSNVVIEGRGVTVNGVATDVANDVVLGDVSVAAGGEWNAANFLETTVTNLTFAANAVVGATVNAEGRAASMTLQGTLTLPATLLHSVSVPEKVTVRRTEILKAAALTGEPSWSRAEDGSTGASIYSDVAARALFLRGHSGTLLYFR